MSRLPRHAHVFAPELLEARVNPVSFSPGSSYLTGGNVMSVALGDVNNDGRLDMAAAVAGSGGVEVRLGDGGGHFTIASNVMMGFAESVKLADLNNDGKLDILAATPVNNSMVIALGNGDGTFQAPIINTLAYGAQDVAAADFNGDGKQDVVAAMPGGAAVMLNNSSGSVVQTPEYFDASGSPDGATVATGDFNGDGNQDFAVSLVGAAEVKVYLGDGTGGFATPFVYDNAGGAEGGRILAADFTGDGKLDLAIGYSDAPQIGLLAGNGDGTFQDPSLIDTSLACNGPIAMGDIDLDGDMDLVAMQAGSGNEVCLLNNGDGTFAAPVAVRYAFPGDTAIGDVTSDGLPDVIIANDLSPGLINVVVNTTRVVGSFTVTAPTTGIAGDSFTVTVTARDNFGATLTGYTGTVHFASSDAIAGLPADYQFTAADAGVHTFTVALRTAGDQSITIHDLHMPTAVGLANVAVSAGATAQFKVEFSGSFAAGVAGTATVTAEDAFGNFTSDYSGTVHLASSDSQATLPPDAALANGTGTFDITLRTAKDPSVTATDATDSTIAGSAAATVTPGVATSLVATAPPDVATGKAFDFTVAAHDQFGNVATSYTGTVHFAGTDPRTSLPGFYHFTAADAGVHSFSLILNTAGSRTVTVTDQSLCMGGISSPTIAVSRGASPNVVADFGDRGLQLWNATTGWTVLTSINAERVSVSDDATALVADFGFQGLKMWTATGGWTSLARVNVQNAVISADGSTVVADFGAGGLRRWTLRTGWQKLSRANVQTELVSADGKTVVADFGAGGLRRWTLVDGWKKLLRLDAESVSQSADGKQILADLGSRGLWLWTPTDGWLVLSRENAQTAAISGDGNSVVADFGSKGLQYWTSTTGWSILTPLDAKQSSITFDGIVVADFGANGLGEWNPTTGWTLLSSGGAELAVPSFDGESVAADFGRAGLDVFGPGHESSSPLDAEGIWVG